MPANMLVAGMARSYTMEISLLCHKVLKGALQQ